MMGKSVGRMRKLEGEEEKRKNERMRNTVEIGGRNEERGCWKGEKPERTGREERIFTIVGK